MQMSRLRLFKPTGKAPVRLCPLLGHITNDGVVFSAAFSEHNKCESSISLCNRELPAQFLLSCEITDL